MDETNYPDSNLPTPQLNDALKELSTIDLINYSIRSEKCKNDVKMMPNKRKVKFGISITHYHYVIEVRSDDSCIGNIKKLYEIDIRNDAWQETGKLKKGVGSKHFLFYWKDKGEGLIFMLNHLKYIFPSSPICYLELGPKPEKDRKAVIQWIKRQELPNVEHCQINYEMTTEMFLHTLKNVKISSHLEILSDLAKELKVNLPEGLEYLSCYARWLTKKQLLSMTNYKQLDIWKSRFRNPDASALINAVLGGGLPKLDYCRININYYDIDKILENVEYEKIEVDWRASWETENILKNGQENMRVKGLCDFNRDDGKIVSLGHCANTFHNGDFLNIYVRS